MADNCYIVVPGDDEREKLRRKIDPEMRYRALGMRNFEKQALAIVEKNKGAKVERTRDAIQITLKQEPSLVLLLTPEALEVRFPEDEWTTTDGPAFSSTLWKREEWANLGDDAVPALIDDARRQRTAQLEKPPAFLLKADGPALMEACRQLSRLQKRQGSAQAQFTFSDGILRISLPHASVGVPATGDWPAEAFTNADFIYMFANTPLATDTVEVQFDNGRVKIGPITLLATSEKEKP